MFSMYFQNTFYSLLFFPEVPNMTASLVTKESLATTANINTGTKQTTKRK